jgi:23S rRNA (cytidine1920-2'-O)/16S rRNA (cytidine1409-2'-O)-methyltransferase
MKSVKKMRIDQLLVERGLAPSRERAQAMVLAGNVLVREQRVDKPSQSFDPDGIVLRIKGPDHPYVGRGGVKLAGALDHFAVDPKGKTCLDVGASTGGFTDCLLQRGAKKVYTLDAGTQQLDFRLRQDPRVIWRENFNARYLVSGDLPEPIDLAVIDVSFISLKLILPPLVAVLSRPWACLALVKPQFEAGPEQVEKGGLVRDPKLHKKILDELEQFGKNLGLNLQGSAPAVIKGDKGNQEYFIYFKAETL